MRKGLIVLLAALAVVAFALPAMADVSFFGYARVIPTYYNNFDFDDAKPDAPITTEAGGVTGEVIRGELRLGWKAGGDKWKIMMTTEADLTYNQNNVDRSPGSRGSTFAIERAEFTYAFSPAFELITGWPISAADIGSGGLLYGDDHPIFGFRGKVTDNFKYQLLYIPINNDPVAGATSTVEGDWRVYLLKPEFVLGTGSANMSLNPILMYSDNRAKDAKLFYYGLEGIGQFGFVKPSFEVIVADGEFRGGPDISAYAAFAGVELGLSKAFNPYIAGRYTSGDDDAAAGTDVEGFVGITDIGRFTPLMGMDGNIMGETMSAGGVTAAYSSFLYSYSPDRGVGGNEYGGFANGGSGNNPGSMILAVGAKGAISEQLSYKAQVFGVWFDKTENLGANVDDYAGTSADILLKYAFDKNFSVTYIGSVFLPGDGIKDQQPAGADDTFASVNTLQLVWTY